MLAKLLHYQNQLDELVPADYAERSERVTDSYHLWFWLLTIMTISAICLRLACL